MAKFALHHRLNGAIAERWRPAASIYLPPLLALSFFNMANSAFSSFLPLYFDHLGLPQSKVAALLSIFPLAGVALALPFGIAGDAALSPKGLSLMGLGLFCASVLSLRLAGSVLALFPLLLLVAASGNLFGINCSSVYYKSLGEGGHGRKIGVLSAAIVLSSGLGPLLAGGILNSAGMEALFLLSFSISLPALIFASMMREVGPAKSSARDYARDLGRLEVLAFVVATFSHAVHMGVESVCLAIFMGRYVGLGPDLMGLVFFLNSAFFSLGALLLGSIFDRKPRPLLLLLLGLLASGGFNFLMPLSRSLQALVAVRFFHVMGDSAAALARGLLVASLFPAERRGGGLGLLGLVLPCGTLLGTALSGLFRDYSSPYIMAGAFEVAGVVALLALRPKFPEPPTGRPLPTPVHHHGH